MADIARKALRKVLHRAVDFGLPPAWANYRHFRQETPVEHLRRVCSPEEMEGRYRLVYPERTASNPLPFNIDDPSQLPDDPHWWGYSMRGVANRKSEPTYLATLHDATILCGKDERGQFSPAILTADGRAINTREIVIRPWHVEILRSKRPARNIERATWICERVYDNHSHWLTAHLPKIRMLQQQGLAAEMLWPDAATDTMRVSLEMLGIDADTLPSFRHGEVLKVKELTLPVTDRFRGELLRPVRDAMAPADGSVPSRRVYISRGKAGMRRLANESDIWPIFEQAGFERVYMEALSFREQVNLMQETLVLAAPHGAGLTNMMFCPPGAHVLEIAWLGFPNPNFYALGSAMGLRWGIVSAEPTGDEPDPLRRDMMVEPVAIERALQRLETTLAPTKTADQ